MIGPVARSLADIDAAFQVLRGYDPRDPRSLSCLNEPPHRRKPLRVGYFPTVGDAPVDPLIAREVAAFARRLDDRSFLVEEIAAPFNAESCAAAWSVIGGAGLAWHLQGFPGWEQVATANTLALAEGGRTWTGADYADALAKVAQVRISAARTFERYDFLLCPATAALAWSADEPFPPEIAGRPAGPRGHAVFTGWMNIAGIPALSIPVAMSPDGGGIGVQLVAEIGRDVELLQVAAGLFTD